MFGKIKPMSSSTAFGLHFTRHFLPRENLLKITLVLVYFDNIQWPLNFPLTSLYSRRLSSFSSRVLLVLYGATIVCGLLGNLAIAAAFVTNKVGV